MGRVMRLSVRNAFVAFRRHQMKRRSEARTIADAIHRFHDQGKAARTFLALSFWSAFTAGCYGYIGESATATVWVCNTPILLLHARKALKSKRQAEAFLESERVWERSLR